jgi:nucleoside-diphosphate-sugar epimerase
MRLLFIGGTGNISTACVDLALERGHEVTILTRGRQPLPPGVGSLSGDRNDPACLREAAGRRFDAVLDFVAYQPAQVEAVIEAFGGKTGQYVFVSSATVYRRPMPGPLTREDDPLGNDHWEYARLKIACEERLVRAHREAGFPATIVRPSYTFGPTWIPSAVAGHDYTLVDRIRRGLPIVSHGDGTSLWVMTYHTDFAVGFVGLVGNPKALGEAFHITSDEVLTWDAIYATIARAAGREAQIVHVPSDLLAALMPDKAGTLLGDKAHSSVFDNAKLKRAVPDYAPKVSFAEGIAKSLAWFDADPGRRVANADANRALDRAIAAQRSLFPPATS